MVVDLQGGLLLMIEIEAESFLVDRLDRHSMMEFGPCYANLVINKLFTEFN